MRSAIFSVGTEILFGQITNTNTVYLSQKLNQMGIDVLYHETVGDNPGRVKEVLELGSHDLFIGQVETVMVREDLIDEKGGVHLEKAGLVAYSHGLYQKIGDVMGFFGWSVAREEVFERRMKDYR